MICWHPFHLLKVLSILFLIHLSPCFSSSILFHDTNYAFHVSENRLPGYIVGQVSATSSDGRQVLLSIVTGNNFGIFMINSTTGIITTTIILNYENVTEYVLTIEASTGDMYNTSSVTIYVDNVDDVSPICESYSYHIYVSDDTPPDSDNPLLRLPCYDIDSVSLEYSIQSGNDQGNFYLSGEQLFLISALNHTQQTSHTLTIRVFDNATIPQMILVRVVVLPDAELPPVFTQDGQYSLSLFENSPLTDIFQVSLTTHYSSSLDVIQYTLFSGDRYNQFFINSSTGVLSLRTSLDRELISNYTLSIMAFDQSVHPIMIRTALATLTVTVLDINDNEPTFNPENLEIIISVDTNLSSPISTLLCSDPDSGENSTIASYSLTNDYIRVEPSSGVVYTTDNVFPLGSSPLLTHQINVECVDAGTPARTGSAVLEITVRQSNNHSPQFSDSFLTFEFEENVFADGRSIFQVTANDDDTDLEGVVFYSLTGGADMDLFFLPVSELGYVHTELTQFDRETRCCYDLQITAVDGAVEGFKRSSTVNVTLNITDDNDNTPTFVQFMYFTTIFDNNTAGMDLPPVQCNDPDYDINGYIIYSLTYNPNDVLSVNPSTGAVFLNSQIRLGSEPSILLSFYISCEDMGVPPLSSLILYSVQVIPLDQHAPMFEQDSYSVQSLKENSLPETFVIQVKATDQDAKIAGRQIEYSISSGNGSDDFTIGLISGNITVNGQLNASLISVYYLVVIAMDPTSTLVDEASVTISLFDINEHAPVETLFIQLSISILENSLPGIEIAQFICSDIDDILPDNITYSIIDPIDAQLAEFVMSANGSLLTGPSSTDCETRDVYDLILLCSDDEFPPLTTQRSIRIRIEGVNEYAPYYDTARLATFVDENQPLYSVIATVEAFDKDCGMDGDIRTYEIKSDPVIASIVLPWFDVTHDGRVITTEYIDSDILPGRVNVVAVEVIAYDNGDPSLSTLDNPVVNGVVVAKISVIINNINNKAPLFSHTNPILILLPENYPSAHVFFTVMCSDPDGLDTVSILPLGNPEPFSVMNGNISVTPGQIIDYELTRQYTFNLNCSDTVFSTSIEVRVLIQPINDHPIRFESNFYQFTLSRTATIGEIIGSVIIVDGDMGGTDLPEILIRNTTEPDNPLTINQLGVLTLSAALDEILLAQLDEEFYLNIFCSDGLFNDTTLVSIMLVEGNLNSPQFLQTIYYFDIFEVAPPSSRIGTLDCIDIDTGSNGEVEYEISNSSPQKDFNILPDGTLQVLNPLNASHTSGYNLLITCMDRGSPVRSNTTTVSISVTGGNNCPPEFINPHTYNANISEDALVGSFVGQVFTTDCDLGENGIATYLTLSHINQFTVSSADGKIFIRGSLDREIEEVIYLKIQAKDTYFNTSQVFTILLLDVNDNSPQCSPTEYHVIISETTQEGTLVEEFMCYDVDKGSNGAFSYTPLTTGSPFSLQPNGSVYLQSSTLLTSVMDHEFKVLVTDNGQELQLSTRIILYVSVAPENKFSPQFMESNVSTSISEVTFLGSLIYSFFATDNDTGYFESKVTYAIESGNIGKTFQIHPDEGRLTLNSYLDFTRTPHYLLVVSASDNAALSPMTSLAMIRISVDEENRFFPVCSSPQYIVYVSEERLAGEISQLDCTDKDGAVLTYSIDSGNLTLFQINSTSGSLSLIDNILDYEYRTNHSLSILVSDGILDIYVTFQILISPVNEFPPLFSSAVFPFTFSEDMTIPSVLTTLSAQDSDRDNLITKHGQVEYMIVSGNEEELFTIGRTNGILYLNEMLDFEVKSFYNLTIVAQDLADMPLSSFCLVHISVDNVNDVQPSFNKDFYIFIINATHPFSKPIGQVMCSDLDFASNSTQLELSLTTQTNYFYLHSQSGLITLVVDVSEISQSYVDLTVSCSDGSLIGYSQVNIFIVQDSSGIGLVKSVYPFSVSESLPVASLIGQISLEGPVTSVDFRLSVNSSFFTIDSDGNIRLASSLDYELQASHSFSVEVSNDNFLTLSVVNIIVTVNDSNDNSPFFRNPLITLSIEESHSEGTPLEQIYCEDSDSSSNGETFLVISSGNEAGYFSLSVSGSFQLNKSIDYEAIADDPIILIQVTCYDKGIPANSVTTNVTYYVLPSNEHGPVFQDTPFHFSPREDTSVGTSVFHVIAIDPDRGADHNIVDYQIIAGNIDNAFLISPTTGEIQLVKSLDHETTDTYTLSVVAIDKERMQAGNVDLSQFTDAETIDVEVLDINDHAPTFSTTFYLATVDEGILSDTFVHSVNCTDVDEGASFLPRFSLAGFGSDLFSISSALNLGIIQTNATISYQSSPSYLLTIFCSDNGVPELTDQSSILITVININQFCPVFTESTARVQLSEAAIIGSFVLRLNATYPNGDENDVTFLLLSSLNNLFRINQTNGDIRTTGLLDFETQRIFTLEVLATNPSSTCNNTANILIDITNVNEHSPQFSQSYFAADVSEAAQVSTNILFLSCSDSDDFAAGISPNVIIESGNFGDKFSVESQRLVLISSLDIETKQNYSLEINCTDNGSEERYTMAIVLISLLSANEFSPLFRNDTYEVSISESATVGTEILTLVATDGDSHGHNIILFSIVSGDDTDKFFLNSDKLLLFDSLDFETQSRYTLNVSVADSVNPVEALYSYALVNIILIDENDNSPVLLPPVAFINLLENTSIGTNILNFSCTDPDEFQNAGLVLNIDSGNTDGQFNLSSNNHLQLALPLQFNTLRLYSLTVSCRDNSSSPKLDSSNIKINIVNTILEQIVFLNTPYAIVVADTSPVGHTVLVVSATDPDSNSSDHLRFSLDNLAEVPFLIDSVSGEIQTTKSLLTFSLQTLTLEIRVVDELMPTRIQFEVAYVTINRTINSPPVFHSDSYFLNISELASPSTHLSILSCSDNENDTLEYSIESGNLNDSFILTALSGILAVKNVLDFESLNLYVLTVSCLDNGIPPQSATARVIISVDPENEFTPVFSQTVYGPISLNEDVLPGVEVTTVTAVDPDSDEDGEVSYIIIDGNSEMHFIIGGSSGRIQVAHFLDFEQIPAYELKIEARDSSLGDPRSSTATVAIHLTDVNDNCPQFIDAPYFSQLPSSAAANMTVKRLECSDLDSGERGRVSISLAGSVEVLQNFQVDSDGVVSLSKNFSLDSSQIYILIPTCSDHALSPCTVTTTLTITSADDNLSPPVFSAASYTVSIPENFPVLNVFFTANATDTDIGMNGIVSYSFRNTQLIFSIYSGTGEIYLSLPLDFESSTSHTVDILATDGTPLSPNRRSSNALLTVFVTDINDNRPNCGNTLFSVFYPDAATIGYPLIQLNCTDPDQGPSGLSYSLSSESSNLFNISNDGLLTVANPVSSDVTITISVSDNFIGDSVQVTNITIMIVLAGQNNFCPQFSQFGYSQDFSESSFPGEVVLVISALDGDTGASGVVDYAIIDGNHLGHFAVEATTGELVLISRLDRESVASYSILVRASDNGLPSPCTNDTLVTIIVTDSNDNRPCLSQPFYSETIPLSTPIDSLILSVSSQDRDTGINSDVLYSLLPANSPPAFSIHPTSGDVTLIKNLSNYSLHVFQYLIWTVDNGTPPLSCSSLLTLYTLQQNVYSPVFNRSLYLLNISENVDTNNALMYVAASDSDSEYILYSITSGNEDHIFYLHPDTGALSLRHRLDYETKSLYTLTVEARDVVLFSGVSLADYSQVSITVTNENDNTPAFEFSSYSVAIDSAVNIGDSVLTVVCTDSDLPPYDNSTLSISDGNANGYFSLNQSGVITTSREVTTLQQELLTLSCSDGELTAYTTVLIIATSSDGPHFSKSVYEWYIEENSQLGTSYTQISILDSNSTVSYDIVSGNNIPIVSIDPTDATIYLVNPVDRELATDYTLTISAYSGGNIIYTILHVIVTDVNDNTPVISTDIVAPLYHYSVSGSVITFLSCQDLDTDNNALTNLYISAGNEENLFALSSGVLLLDKPIGYQPVYSLAVSCSDSGMSPLSSTTLLNIEVIPVNRYSPEFVFDQLFVDVFEDTIVGSTLVTLSAVDRDEGKFGDVSYRIIAGNELNLFGIDSDTGELSLVYPLDFESVQTHRITISATDGGYGSAAARSSTADVTIRVFDINDNSPYLDSDIYTLHISLNSARGTDLLSVTCTDADSGDNGDVTYGFINESAPFAVYNGSIFLALSLEYSIADFISLTLECRDRGSPSLVTSAVLYVIISRDELAPEFSQTTYSLPLSELAQLNTKIITITAEDRDEGNNGIVSYQLVNCLSDCPFSIHSITGIVSLLGPLDYETRPFYSLRVQALDIGTFSHTSEATLEIQVINENDNLPQFSQTLHTASVSEDATMSTPVISLHCYDLDMDKLNYSINAGLKNTNAFSISSDGILLVSDQLDFETTSFYSLSVQCSDGRDTVYSIAQVSITNVNEFTPTFNQTRYTVSVRESLTFGFVILSVSAVDGDADSLGEITYSLVGGNTQQTFGILSTMGTVFLMDSLDYETTPTYSLILFATDRDGHVGRTDLDIQVININDNSPVFAPSIYSRVLSIDEYVGVNIIELRCSDKDGDVLAFKIESGNTGNYFNVSQSGLVAVSRNLTGSNPVLILRISCSDMSTQPLAVAIFSINILRDSDCGIQFSKDAPYLAHVSEDVGIGHLVLTLSVNGSSNDVTFRLEPTSVHFYVDSVDSSGHIRVLKVLDADTLNHYTFNVIATPNDVSCSNPPQTSVTILIDDVNEFSPLVTPSIKTLFLEENLVTPSLITQFQCNDSDVSNNQVTFLDSLADDSPINIDANGRVTLNIYLDYEFQQLHTFMIKCIDSAVRPKTGTATLFIRVTPQNEFTPSFSLPSYQFEVLESVLPGYSVGCIGATDGDSSLSGDGVLSYSHTNTTQFTVKENGDVLVSAVLDRESVAKITFLGFANDNGNISMSSSVLIVILVLDSNDNPPLFHPLVISVSLEYNQSIIDPIAVVRCTDLDEGNNARLKLEFAAGFNYSYSFSEQTGGQGEVNASLVTLSPPSEGLITFEIVCTDSGNISLSSTALVSILVSRECYSPQLSPMYHATFSEDIPTGTTVVRPSAQFDPLCPHEFHILSGQVGDFAINKTEGYIYVSSPLDFETLPTYEISISLISLTSTGAKSSTASVFITLTNINDNSPVIEPALLTLTLSENTPVNHIVTGYSCSDVDNDMLEFSKSGDLDAKFNLDGQGVLTLLNSLDFEDIRIYDLSISCYEVAATGTIHTSTAQLVVLVSAVNDNEPSFDQSTYTDTVSENTAIGTTVLSVSASDNDLTTPHNKTIFALSGANSHLFRVTSEGSLVTADFLDAETSFGIYQFSVLAFNPAPGVSTATAVVRITLTDVNEDPPVCGGGVINLVLEPGVYISQSVGGTLVCTDTDISPPSFTATLNGDFGNDPSLTLSADLFGSSLSLSLSGTVSYPNHVTPNKYTLTVSDGGTPPMTGDTVVYIRVNPPPGALSFVPSTRTVSVGEDFPLGDELVDVGALLTGDDKDFASYSTSFPLSVTSEGVVTLSSSLDYETSTFHSVEIRAEVSSQFNTFTLNIQVTDYNDNEPVFSGGNILRFTLREDTSPSVVTTLTASDADSGTNGAVTFSQISGTGLGLFSVSANGVVRLTGSLDREEITQYSIQVRASDSGSPSLSAVAVIFITISDVNDNSPIFLEDSSGLVFSVEHTIPKGNVIHTFQVTDLDLNPTFTFLVFGSASAQAAFRVNPAGELYILDDLINIPSQTFEFTVSVSDGLGTDSISVRVLVSLVSDVELTLSENSPIGTVVWDAFTFSKEGYVPTGNAQFFLILGNFQDRFEIDSASGILANIGEIDYEDTHVYTFLVEIDDPTNLVSTNLKVSIYLLVLDENDNPPEFTLLAPSVVILESNYITPYLLAQVSANDLDSGLYAQLEYHLIYSETEQEASELPFYFTFDGSLFVQGEVDRELYSLLELLIRVRDKSQTPLSTTTPIQIAILDINDNPPSFVDFISPIEIINNLPDNTVFYEFYVSDPDAGDNGTIQISLTQITNPSSPYFDFNLEQALGLVQLIKTAGLLGLSEDELFYIDLRLNLTDMGSPPLTHSQNFKVAVKPFDIRPSFQSYLYWVDLLYSAPIGTELLTVGLEVELDSIYFLLDLVDENDFMIDSGGTLYSVKEEKTDFENYYVVVTARNQNGGKESSTNVIVNTLTANFITELLLNISYQVFTDNIDENLMWLDDQVPSQDTFQLVEYHIQDGIVNVSLYVKQGVYYANNTSPGASTLGSGPKPFLQVQTICDLYFSDLKEVLACRERYNVDTVGPEQPMSLIWIWLLAVFIAVLLLLLLCILLLCLGAYIYYKRQEEKILMDESIFDHPYMIARPLGAYEMQEELLKFDKRGRSKPSMVRSYGDEERAYQLGRGREYHSSDENIDETFMNEYASSESSISVYGQDYSQFEQMETWQKYRNMGPHLRQMVERWRDGDNIILEDDESKGEMSA